jgi:two-component system, LytTR family, response regulator
MSSDNKLSAIIVDDSLEFRVIFKKMLSQFDEINIIGEAESFGNAVLLIKETNPDVVFLDIDLDGNNSIDDFNELNLNENTRVVFNTSHEDFAVQAFELNAVDYLVKPVTMDRLRITINRLKVPATTAAPSEEVTEDVFDSQEKYTMDKSILLKYDSKMSFEKLSNIVYISSLGNYTKIFLANGKVSVVYSSMKNWEDKLPADFFVRIHRGTILNLQYVEKIIKWNNDSGRVFLKNMDTPLDVSRSYYTSIKSRFKS